MWKKTISNRFLFLVLAILSLGMTSCSKDTVLMTSTTTGVSGDGDIAAVPDHLTVGYRRREMIFTGHDSAQNGSVLATLDSSTTWNKGTAIRQVSATGHAADIVANGGSEPPRENTGTGNENEEPLTFVSNTVIGLKALLAPLKQGESVGATLGYKRRVVTRVRPNANDDLASTYSNTSVHGTSAFGGTADIVVGSLPDKHRLSQVKDSSGNPTDAGGVRIRQSFAIGTAAEKLLVKTQSKKDKVSAADDANDALIEKPSSETPTE